MTPEAVGVAYAAVALLAGLLAGALDYRDDPRPSVVGSGCVGLFFGAFWPVAGLVVAMGYAAKAVARRLPPKAGRP